jgi:uncharacterized protein (DUF58 family)
LPRSFRALKSRSEVYFPEADLNRWHPPFSFAITRTGGVYILAVFLIAVAAVNTGNNLMYLILSILLSATLAAGIVARLSLRSIFVSLQVPQHVFVGEEVSIKISLTNQKRWCTSFSIQVEDLALLRARRRRGILIRLTSRIMGPAPGSHEEDPVLQHAAYFPAIPPGESRAELISQSFTRRGLYRLEGLRLSTQFPFGIFRRGERISVSGNLLVYPLIREISSDLHLLPFLPGKLEGRRPGHGESLYAIRHYHDGESARLIHWKATAKTGKLMTREYAREEESEFCLILDTIVESAGQHDTELFEKAVSLAASLAAHFANEAADFEFLTPRDHVPRGTGSEHLYQILRSLAVVTPAVRGAQDLPGTDRDPAAAGPGTGADLVREFSGALAREILAQIWSDKVYKILLTSRQRGRLPASVWHSSYVIYFDEL